MHGFSSVTKEEEVIIRLPLSETTKRNGSLGDALKSGLD